MHKREAQMGDLLCACGAKGLAHWSENKNPARAGGKVTPVVFAIVGQFTLTLKRGDLPPLYLCGHCGRSSSARTRAWPAGGHQNDA